MVLRNGIPNSGLSARNSRFFKGVALSNETIKIFMQLLKAEKMNDNKIVIFKTRQLGDPSVI